VEGRGKVEEYRAGSKHRVSVMAMPCIWGGESIGYTGVCSYQNSLTCSFKICTSLYIYFTSKKKNSELGWNEYSS